MVTAVDFEALESAPSGEANALPPNAVPGPPTGLNASPGDGTVSLTWTASPDVDVAGYNVYRDSAKGNAGQHFHDHADPGRPPRRL